MLKLLEVIKKKHLGLFGDIGTFSFYGNKTISTGEGGMIIFKNKKYFKRAKLNKKSWDE